MSQRAFPHRPRGVTPAERKAGPTLGQLAREFAAGASMTALARKYGVTALAVQAMLREAARKGKTTGRRE